MDKRQVSRIMRISDEAKAQAIWKALRYQARCKIIAAIEAGAHDG